MRAVTYKHITDALSVSTCHQSQIRIDLFPASTEQ